jgi:hypothetical protein
LPQLWYDGSWRGLAVATAFGAALNALSAVSLVWYALATPAVKGAGWLSVVGVWLAAAVVSWRWLVWREAQNHRQSQQAAAEDLYPAAVNEYLKRNFVAAERRLLKVLAADERDCAAGLLLAAVWRRTGRTSEARRELERLARLEAAGPWMMEVGRELKLLDKLDKADELTNDPSGDQSKNSQDQTKAA